MKSRRLDSSDSDNDENNDEGEEVGNMEAGDVDISAPYRFDLAAQDIKRVLAEMDGNQFRIAGDMYYGR
jgi:hypothetical protein